MSTESHGSRLAARPNTLRDRVTVRSAAVTREIAERRRRVAFCELFSDAPRKPDYVYEQQRRHPRHPLPDARHHALILEGIREGYISRQRIMHYCAAQLIDYLDAFPSPTPASERIIAAVLREMGEGAESALVAEGTPSINNRMHGARELREAGAMCELGAELLERGTLA